MLYLGQLASNIGIGLHEALSLQNLWFCLIGASLGMLVGVLPGVGALTAISLLFPITFHLPPTSALVMLGGIYYGTAYGGSTASILLNIPGTPSSAITCLDGYPMAKQGRAGVALLLATLASFVAGSFGILIMMLFSNGIADIALNFGSAEYFALMAFGLLASCFIADANIMKSLTSVVVGLLLGTVGMDIYSGVERFTFGFQRLSEGVNLVTIAIGLFGVAELIYSIPGSEGRQVAKPTLRSLMPTRDDLRRSWKPTLRGSLIGAIFGALPGAGPTLASFISYTVEKRVAKEPERFGKGAVEGVCGPEAANNAADQTAFIPTLALGVPGTATMALVLGVLMVHGIPPGPALLTDHIDLFWGLVMSFWIGNLILVVLNIPLISIWVYILSIPYRYLFPAILMFICLGTVSLNIDVFDLYAVIAFGLLGVIMRARNYPLAPLILAFVLGPLTEEHFRRAMILSGGHFSTFVERPLSGSILGVALASTIVFAIYAARKKKGRAAIDGSAAPSPQIAGENR